MSFVLSWLGATVFGALMVLMSGASLNVLELAGLAPLVGAGVLSFAFCVAAMNGKAISSDTLLTVAIPIAVIAANVVVRRARREGWSIVAPSERPTRAAYGWIAVVALLLVYAFASGWYWPPWGGDSLTVWVLKGRNIRDFGSISASARNAAGLFYPLNLPLQVAALWPALGPEHICLLFPPYLLGLVLVVAGFLSRRLASERAWLAAALVASTPLVLGQASTAMSDIAFAFYYVSSALFLFRALESGSFGDSMLSAILLALAAWTRADGLLYLIVNLAVIVVFGSWRSRPLHTLATAAIVPALFFGVWLTWNRYVDAQGWGGHFEASGEAALRALLRGEVRWDAAATIGSYFAGRWVRLTLWGATWLAFAGALVLLRMWRPLRMYLLAIALNIVALLFTYYAWVYYRPDALTWTLDAGFDRMATHFAPLLWIYAALALNDPKGSFQSNKL